MIYEPAEDSFLLQRHIKSYPEARGIVLDMGTGSGIQAVEAAKYADKVIAVDINPKAIEYCRKTHKEKKITWKVSDLFDKLDNKILRFDLIIFNPPYLPEDKREPADSKTATTGGKKGYEVIERFLGKAGKYLKDEGVMLLLFSTLSGEDKINKIIDRNNFRYKQIGSQKLFFEEIKVYEIRKYEKSFSSRVLELAARIPKGKVTTYKIIAEKLGTRAYRAVGQTLRNNKQPRIIPCHRVINSDSSVGAYNGIRNSQEKINLLKKEGIKIKKGKVNMIDKFLYNF